MAIPRKVALDRLHKLQPRVTEHLNKIYANPGHSSQKHWRHEVRTWLGVMESMVQHVGQKTGAEWRPILQNLRERLDAAPQGP